MSRNEITPDMMDSRKYRIKLRKMLIEKIESERQRLNITRLSMCARIGMCPTGYHRLINGSGSTIDSLILYLYRLGIGIEIKIKLTGEKGEE